MASFRVSLKGAQWRNDEAWPAGRPPGAFCCKLQTMFTTALGFAASGDFVRSSHEGRLKGGVSLSGASGYFSRREQASYACLALSGLASPLPASIQHVASVPPLLFRISF